MFKMKIEAIHEKILHISYLNRDFFLYVDLSTEDQAESFVGRQ